MDYPAARAALDRLPRFEVKPGLDRVAQLLEGLGHPERAYPAIHVTGTNGKGSAVAMLDAILRAASYRVGRFTSPDVVDFRDRIAIDGKWLTEPEWAAGVERMAETIEAMDDPPAQFEAITALALDAFARTKIDVALVEVGLGGRFDATNVVRPILSILTNVALDHTGLLGDSVEAIAWEKVGIAKPNVPLLVGPLKTGALKVAEAECAKVGASLARSEDVGLRLEFEREEFSRYRVDAADLPPSVDLPLLGGYQRENLRIVLRAIQLLREAGLVLSSDAVAEGLGAVSWPGRFEIVRRSPTIILEGAHNVAGAQALAADVERRFPVAERRGLVFGALADKDVAGMLRVLAPHFARLVLTQSSSPRALPVEDLAQLAEELRAPFACYDSVRKAVAEGVARANPKDVWVIAGSLTVVGAARRILEDGQ